MNMHILNAKIKQMRGKTKVLRSKLTRQKLNSVPGRIDIAIGWLEEKYWKSRQGAAKAIKRNTKGSSSRSRFTKKGSY